MEVGKLNKRWKNFVKVSPNLKKVNANSIKVGTKLLKVSTNFINLLFFYQVAPKFTVIFVPTFYKFTDLNLHFYSCKNTNFMAVKSQ
jgi:hypothetical protein